MKTRNTDRHRWLWPLFCGLCVALSGLLLTAAADDEEAISPKLERQLRLMETLIDEVLLDSPHLLVFSNSPTHGIFLDDYGAVFTLEASLVGSSILFDSGKAFSFFDKIRVGTEDGRVVIWRSEDDDEDDEDEEDDEDGRESRRYRVRMHDSELIDIYGDDEDGDEEPEDDENLDAGDAGGEAASEEEREDAEDDEDWADEDDGEDDDDDVIIDLFGPGDGTSWKELRRKKAVQARENYQAGKHELIDVLIGYGDSMTRLADDHWIVIAAFLKQSDFFDDEEISRLVLKARMGDLRDYGRERISAEEMAERVAISEY